jgi:hypothetical protein
LRCAGLAVDEDAEFGASSGDPESSETLAASSSSALAEDGAAMIKMCLKKGNRIYT